MKRWIGIMVGLVLVGCASQQPSAEPSDKESEPVAIEQPGVVLQDFGLAPELENTVWLNTEQPLRLANLRGQVVLLDMWTFG
jgi:uncharacterized lipoprotein YmbA